MKSMMDKNAEYIALAPPINMTDKDFKLEPADLSQLDTNYYLDSYAPRYAMQVKMCPHTDFW